MNTTEKKPLLGLDMVQLKQVATEMGLPAFAAKQMAQWLYVHHATDIEAMTNISAAGRKRLAEAYCIGVRPPLNRLQSVDGTVKYLFPTADGQHVETVFIPDGERGTVCVSCQVGCRMGCRFCMTGRQGFHGNLTVTDILNQLFSIEERERVTNVVFMGQGEPMDNLDAVLAATRILTADYGWAWSPKRITVSTVGVKKGLERFLEESDCHLAVSLHNPFPTERREIMPAEGGYSLADCIALLALQDWSHQRRLSFEYIVFGGLNDTEAHARELVRLLGPIECRMNLIRFHDIPDSPFRGAPEEKMVWLRDYLTRHGVTTTIRASRGQDYFAACGLLSTAESSAPRPISPIPSH